MERSTLPSSDCLAVATFDAGMLTRSAADAASGEIDHLQSAFDNATVGIFQTTPEGRFLRVNPTLTRLLGYRSPEAMISTVNDIARELYVDPRRRDEFARMARANGAVMNFESQVYRHGGEVIWISENAWAVQNAAGALAYFEGFVEDVTEQKRDDQIALLRGTELSPQQQRYVRLAGVSADSLSTSAQENEPAAGATASEREAASASPFHLESLLHRCLEDATFCSMILQKFADRSGDLMKGLERAADSGNAAEVAVQAHTIKAVASNLSAEVLRSRSAELERMAGCGTLGQIATALAQVQAESDRCLQAVPGLLEQIGRQAC